MKKTDVEIGATYIVKVGSTLSRVRVEAVSGHGGWCCRNLETNRQIRVLSPQKFRKKLAIVNPGPKQMREPRPPSFTDRAQQKVFKHYDEHPESVDVNGARPIDATGEGYWCGYNGQALKRTVRPAPLAAAAHQAGRYRRVMEWAAAEAERRAAQ